jgi:hypothetical protein
MAMSLEAVSGLSDSWSWAGSSSLQANLGVRGQRSRAEFSFDASALSGAAAAIAKSAAALPGSSSLVLGSTEAAAAFRLRTLWAKLDLDWASIQVGRQVINYGRGALWSPVDLFAAVDLSGLSPDRLGVDAVRLRVPLGDLSGLDLVAAPTAAPEKGRYATRIAGDLLGIDGGLLGAWDGQAGRVIAAADCKFDLGAAFYAEALWSLDPGATDPASTGRARAAAGFDWSFGEFMVAGECYLNGGGAAEDPAFPAKFYLFGQAAWSFSDYGSLALGCTADPANAAIRGQFSLLLEASQNATVTAFADLMWGNFALESATGSRTTLGALLAVKF